MRHCAVTFSPEILSALARFLPIGAAQRVETVLQNLSLHLITLN